MIIPWASWVRVSILDWQVAKVSVPHHTLARILTCLDRPLTMQQDSLALPSCSSCPKLLNVCFWDMGTLRSRRGRSTEGYGWRRDCRHREGFAFHWCKDPIRWGKAQRIKNKRRTFILTESFLHSNLSNIASNMFSGVVATHWGRGVHWKVIIRKIGPQAWFSLFDCQLVCNFKQLVWHTFSLSGLNC